jgi:hypothetical protein
MGSALLSSSIPADAPPGAATIAQILTESTSIASRLPNVCVNFANAQNIK